MLSLYSPRLHIVLTLRLSLRLMLWQANMQSTRPMQSGSSDWQMIWKICAPFLVPSCTSREKPGRRLRCSLQF